MHCKQFHYNDTIGTHVMNCRTDLVIDFDSKTETMELKCPFGNAEGINDLRSLMGSDPSSHRGVIACSIGAYTAIDNLLREIGSMTVQTYSNINA